MYGKFNICTVADDKFYKPRALGIPIMLDTALKVNRIVNKLFSSGNIDTMTHKWLTIGLTQPRIPEFYTPTKIDKKPPVGRPIVSGSSSPTERISSFVDSLLEPIGKKQESYLKNTTDFINFIKNTQISDVVLATLDVSSFCRNIPQTEGIYVVSRLYDLRELLRLILEENSFKSNDIFSLWDISMRQEVSNFVHFANSFHPTIKFTCEMSSETRCFS